ncbi:hypothetical protein, conserved [Eimeria necatrix]|uniref:Dynein heavy chain tail domain-containing protein n=1 Tax=Eimeria necatrix TaxID=51315 RepID=U6N1N0_9EIME|nr:hypothetical protein, conserved [Eimeria necatrix]CDJ70102.1 hypothetical protein, conserved [Eimeria necatrix]
MATLTPRHRWMVAQVVSSFKLAEYEPLVEALFRDQFAIKIDPFLKGTSSTQYLLFSYHAGTHPASPRADIPGKLICSVLAASSSQTVVTSCICAAEGVSDEAGSKYVYFLRTIPFGKSLNLSTPADAELAFGELPELPLQALHTALSGIFLPTVEHFDKADWKKCTDEQRNEFLACTRTLCKELGEAIDALAHGIQLKQPDPRFSLADIRMDYIAAAKNPDIVSHFEELLDDWCKEIERYLEASLDKGAAIADNGPRSELASGVSPKSRQSVFHTMRRCKQLDVAITEAFSEAKDNVKYLATLERFIDPLYSGNPASILESLSALMSAITMIHSISRYYNTTERMVSFFTKITKQACCYSSIHRVPENS